MNPWHELFIEGDDISIKGITTDQNRAGMRVMSIAFNARHKHTEISICRKRIGELRADCHPRLHPIIDRCLAEQPDTP